MKNGALIVISGPSGVGKTTIVKKILDHHSFVDITTTTTRTPRSGEVNGVDYDFCTREEFQRNLTQGLFLEHAEIYGNFYGTPKQKVEEAIAQGYLVILEIDVQGAQSIKKIDNNAFLIFLKPPDLKELKDRLEGRESENREEITKRIEWAEWELSQIDLYDASFTNVNVEHTVQAIFQELTQRGILSEQ